MVKNSDSLIKNLISQMYLLLLQLTLPTSLETNTGGFVGFQNKIHISKEPRIQFYFSCFTSVLFLETDATVQKCLQNSTGKPWSDLLLDMWLSAVESASGDIGKRMVFASSSVRCCRSVLLRKELLSSWCGLCSLDYTVGWWSNYFLGWYGFH